MQVIQESPIIQELIEEGHQKDLKKGLREGEHRAISNLSATSSDKKRRA